MRILFFATTLILYSCKGDTQRSDEKEIQSEVKEEQMPVKPDTIESVFSFDFAKDKVENGEEIKYHQNGALYIKGMMKNGKRNGLWKSWYENGTPWSETTFEDGKKTGKTVTWYENGKKRYEGYYINNIENGKWTFWDEQGNTTKTKDYGIK
ncbi:MAG: toxin-antitoxin system YwqK family antitoxin [Bacteroidota bacterium]